MNWLGFFDGDRHSQVAHDSGQEKIKEWQVIPKLNF